MAETDLPMSTRAWFLDRRPEGLPKAEDFSIREVPLAPLADGEVLVENVYLSVDPYMRRRMSSAPLYMEPFAVGEAMDGPAVGRVVASRSVDVAVGSHVFHNLGWREHGVLPASETFPVDPAAAPLASYLGALGIPGLTAYVAVTRFGEVGAGDTVYVSAAAGAVGSIAGQLAALRGARVIGSVSNETKARELVESFGYDAAFVRTDRPIAESLAELAPDGVDVVIDNVGGESLEAGIGALRVHGRFVLVGMMAQYNDEEVQGPRNLWHLSITRSKILAFMVSEEMDLRPAFLSEVAGLIAAGTLTHRETVRSGFENTLDALFAMMRGENSGKMVVQL